MSEYSIDICDTGNMMNKFCDKYDMGDIDDYQKIFSIFFDEIYDRKNNKPNKILGNYCELKDISIGDYVRVQYICYSQTYSDFYQDIEGYVIHIDDKKNNGLIYNNINNIICVNSIVKEYCSYYGETPGYCCYISK